MSERRNPSRRGVIQGSAAVGGGIVSTALLAACGATVESGTGGGADASTASGVLPLGDVPVGGGTVVASTETVVTQPAAGEFYAFSSICTHQGCAVANVTAEHIVCPCHGSRYDVRTGEPVAGPAELPLAQRNVTVTETEVEYS